MPGQPPWWLAERLLGSRVFRLDENELDAHQGYIETMAEQVAQQERAALAVLPVAARSRATGAITPVHADDGGPEGDGAEVGGAVAAAVSL